LWYEVGNGSLESNGTEVEMVNAGGYISLGFALRTTRDKRNKRK